jgi:hypothetical protein
MGLVVLVTAMLLVPPFYQAEAQTNSGLGSDRATYKSHAEKGVVLDFEGNVITEEEISRIKTNQKVWVYTASGAAISLGTSFFVVSMIARSSDRGIKDTIVYTGTAAGTLLGTFFFARAGRNKDRQMAIDRIRLERFESGTHEELLRETRTRDKLLQEIERIKREVEKRSDIEKDME